MTEEAKPGVNPRVRMPSDRGLAIILAIAAATFVWVAWGGLDRPGLYHDEKAYVLQARIYADLKLAEPSPPVPELWEQVHVFTQPHYAGKYPPGFSAVLAFAAALATRNLPMRLNIVVAIAVGVSAGMLLDRLRPNALEPRT